jgi:hypothetical protein
MMEKRRLTSLLTSNIMGIEAMHATIDRGTGSGRKVADKRSALHRIQGYAKRSVSTCNDRLAPP